MDNKQGLPNKYRPQTFEQYVGNKAALSQLQVQVFSKTPEERYHAILIAGPMGAGKSTLAGLIAKVLTEGNDAGIINYNTSSNNTVDDARALEEELNSSSILASTRVFIFEEAHRITPAAADILLTTIENMPIDTYAIFVTTEPTGIRATLRDRLLPLNLVPLNETEIRQLVGTIAASEGIHLTDGIMNLLVKSYAGSNRRLVKNIALVAGCKNVLEAEQLIEHAEAQEEEGEIIDVVKAMLSANWNSQAAFQQLLNRSYDKIKANPESARISAGAYITKCLLANPKNTQYMFGLSDLLDALGGGQFTYPNAHLKFISIMLKGFWTMAQFNGGTHG
jgi:DNA polymerase III gamma/tau subunit